MITPTCTRTWKRDGRADALELRHAVENICQVLPLADHLVRDLLLMGQAIETPCAIYRKHGRPLSVKT